MERVKEMRGDGNSRNMGGKKEVEEDKGKIAERIQMEDSMSEENK